MSSEEVLFVLECYIIAKVPEAVNIDILVDMNTGGVAADFDIPYEDSDEDDECNGNCKKCDRVEDCVDDEDELISTDQRAIIVNAIKKRAVAARNSIVASDSICRHLLCDLKIESLDEIKKSDYDKALDIIKYWKGGDKKIEI